MDNKCSCVGHKGDLCWNANCYCPNHFPKSVAPHCDGNKSTCTKCEQVVDIKYWNAHQFQLCSSLDSVEAYSYGDVCCSECGNYSNGLGDSTFCSAICKSEYETYSRKIEKSARK